MVVRRDLSPGLQSAQATHAAIGFCMAEPEAARAWHDQSNNLVILSVEDEAALLAVLDRAWTEGIRYEPFYEPDLNDEMTAVAFGPSESTARLLSALPLALRETAMA